MPCQIATDNGAGAAPANTVFCSVGPTGKTVCSRPRRSVAKTLFLNELGRFFIRNEHQSKAQSHDLALIMTYHCDRYGHTCGFFCQEPPLNGQIIKVKGVKVKGVRPGYVTDIHRNAPEIWGDIGTIMAFLGGQIICLRTKTGSWKRGESVSINLKFPCGKLRGMRSLLRFKKTLTFWSGQTRLNKRR